MFLRLIFVAGVALASAAGQAAIYKCMVNNVPTFQQLPCESGPQEVLKQDFNEQGIHNDWLEKPVYLRERATCSERGCVCETQFRRFLRNEVDLLNAIKDLPVSMNALTDVRDAYRSLSAEEQNSAELNKVIQAACRVSINQAAIDYLVADVLNSRSSADLEAMVEFYGIETPKCDTQAAIAGKCNPLLTDAENFNTVKSLREVYREIDGNIEVLQRAR